PAVLVVVADGDDQPAAAVAVPAQEVDRGELVAVLAGRVGPDLGGDQVEPDRIAGGEGDEGEACLALDVADLRANVERLGVPGRGHPVGDEGLPRVPGRLADAEDGVAAGGLDGDPHDVLVGGDVDRLGASRFAGLLTRLPPLARLGLAGDVLEQLALLGLEEGTLAFGLALPARLALADVGELSERAVGEVEAEEVVALDEEDAAAVAGEDGARLSLAGVGEAPDVERATVDQEEVAVVRDDAPAPVRGDLALREERADGVGRLVGEALRRAAPGRDAIERSLLVPRAAARLPEEVDPAAVVGPANGSGRLADMLGAAHDVGDAELEGRNGFLCGCGLRPGGCGDQPTEGQEGSRRVTRHCLHWADSFWDRVGGGTGS